MQLQILSKQEIIWFKKKNILFLKDTWKNLQELLKSTDSIIIFTSILKDFAYCFLTLYVHSYSAWNYFQKLIFSSTVQQLLTRGRRILPSRNGLLHVTLICINIYICSPLTILMANSKIMRPIMHKWSLY